METVKTVCDDLVDSELLKLGQLHIKIEAFNIQSIIIEMLTMVYLLIKILQNCKIIVKYSK